MDQVIVPDNYIPIESGFYTNPYFALFAIAVLIVFALALRLVFKSTNGEYVHNHQFE